MIAQTSMTSLATRPRTLSDALVALLVDSGVQHVFGVLGGTVAPFAHALDQSDLAFVHCRHEAGAAFAATEAYFASGRPSAVLTVGGPGLTNALTGALAAKWEGAKMVLVSGATSRVGRGRGAFQETSAYATPLLEPAMTASAFDLAVSLEDVGDLENLAVRMRVAMARPEGWVAHVRLPLDAQTASASAGPRGPHPESFSLESSTSLSQVAERCAGLLSSAPFAIWVGFGARHASAQVRLLSERARAKVMCTPRGKGIFPESHASFVGVTGFGGHDSVRRYLERERPERILVLGTRLEELSSFWDPALVPPQGFIHVDVDPTAPGTAFPTAPVRAVHGEIGAFLDALLPRFPPHGRAPTRPRGPSRIAADPEEGRAQGDRNVVGLYRLMAAVQRRIIDGSDAIVLTEAGNAFAWGNHVLRFDDPGRYRTSMGWGSMGHASAGVIGAAVGGERKAVALVGDGAMLMNSEVSTAVQYGIPAVWIVLNDARYGMVEQGLLGLGLPVRASATTIPPCDFAAIARAMGASGARVERESELDSVLERAMSAAGPFVVDVLVDPDEPSPLAGRLRSLSKQSFTGEPT